MIVGNMICIYIHCDSLFSQRILNSSVIESFRLVQQDEFLRIPLVSVLYPCLDTSNLVRYEKNKLPKMKTYGNGKWKWISSRKALKNYTTRVSNIHSPRRADVPYVSQQPVLPESLLCDPFPT